MSPTRDVPGLARRGLVGVTLACLVASCATRLPVVTDPVYPDFIFPTVPPGYADSPAAREHTEAWTFLQTGDLAMAESRYASALERVPGFYPSQAGLGWLSLARNELEAAARYFERATAEASTYVPALLGHGEVMLALERPEAALASYEAALRADGGLVDVQRLVEELRFSVVTEQLAMARQAAAARRFDVAAAAYERVIAASPDSGFLQVELGRVEQERGNDETALQHARRAVELDPLDPEAFLLQAEILEARGDLPAALAAYERADAVDPTEATARHLERVRDRLRLADLPPELLDVATKANVTRGELAALLGVRLADVLAERAGQPVIITDTRDHWASQWIQAVADAGVMSVDAAYRFSPTVGLRRSELADVVAAALDGIEASTGGLTAGASGRGGFSDMRPSHLSYRAAVRSVSAGILDALENDSFQPSRPVTGAEAVAVADRLAELVRELR